MERAKMKELMLFFVKTKCTNYSQYDSFYVLGIDWNDAVLNAKKRMKTTHQVESVLLVQDNIWNY
jgi:hypothetical protein